MYTPSVVYIEIYSRPPCFGTGSLPEDRTLVISHRWKLMSFFLHMFSLFYFSCDAGDNLEESGRFSRGAVQHA